ncbi:MAG: Holliday junction DNA helicase RuvB [Candidatus Harrisonbacteria bacterium RIFCSPHIGHO2_01_FULL_44_13]|uniref:Holliday junction branch migration complex subunit RuvB n=1 Tax=Candidatus Harrisonbacteria bacterium RIFCSPLOWO2_01_FULL_44_18 TaxID=1798407 RepID=A0A1G1ZPP5_9BACT|nr:MAG: Holliday junction DNA helicase RuvB [Candidatus Harrisonbacteria bacterium RIFCSPHIGHO2_01_FULL_44_13]OGY65710.1 MAG: Holliday junction DNA helicase RuvB [Candidatus Harrisonbacteria bacterium RIFCSPLOWO2_01_FULL_44_18]
MSSAKGKTLLNPKNDQTVDSLLRPAAWNDYVGQEKVKRNLKIILEAAKKRQEVCDHLLFYGQAGLGKTTLAHLVAKELGANFKVTSGPALEKMGDLAAVLSNLESGDLLFIDEVHRLNRLIEEVLYPAMETRKLHLVVGKGPGARTLTLDLPPFTLVAATTRINLLSGPLRSRFGATLKLDYYEVKDIEAILKRSGELLGLKVDPAAIKLIANASRFTPRVANRLLKRVRDYAEVHDLKLVDESAAKNTLELLEIDELGLEPHDRRLLEAIIKKFNGGPVGVATLSAALNEDKGNVEDVYEPYLMSIGFLSRTPSGRMATRAAYEHLGLKPPEGTLI